MKMTLQRQSHEQAIAAGAVVEGGSSHQGARGPCPRVSEREREIGSMRADPTL